MHRLWSVVVPALVMHMIVMVMVVVVIVWIMSIVGCSPLLLLLGLLGFTGRGRAIYMGTWLMGLVLSIAEIVLDIQGPPVVR
jgi:hypothetical protein